jgi:CheY-like chemotaxis protein
MLCCEPDSSEDIVQKIGLTVIETGDGAEAMNVLDTQKIDFVFLDIKLPKINGDKLLLHMRKKDPTSKVKYIVVSGGILTEYSTEERLVIRQLASAYVKKPFCPNDIVKALIKARS